MGLFSHLTDLAGMHAGSDKRRNAAVYVGRVLLLAFAYFAIARLSLELDPPPDIAIPLWLPAGLALLAGIAWGFGIAPAILVSAALANYSVGIPLWQALATAAGNVVELLVALYLLRLWPGALHERLFDEQPARCAAIVVISCAAAATVGLAALSPGPEGGGEADAVHWLTWWVGDTAGMLVAAPLLPMLRRPLKIEWKPAKVAELAAFIPLLFVVTELVFNNSFEPLPLAYLPLPFMLWAAFRFSPPSIPATAALICAIAVWNTVHGNGPFVFQDRNSSLLLVMGYVIVVGGTGVVLASVIAQRRTVERKLREERDLFETHVREKTRALLDDIDERQRVEQQLAEAQQLAQIGSWSLDRDSGRLTWSQELYHIFGVDPARFTPSIANASPMIPEEDLRRLDEAVTRCRRTEEPFHIEHRLVPLEGPPKIVASRGRLIRSENGKKLRLVGTIQDITEAKRTETSLRDAEERYRTVVELSPDAILVQQNGRYVFANHAACALLAARSADEIVGKSIFELIHPDYHHLAEKRMKLLHSGTTVPVVELRMQRFDGSVVDVELNAAPFPMEGGPASLVIMRDITERKQTIEKMVHLAHYDSLTGLPNRMLFHQRLEHALDVAERPGRSLEILFLDLDRFKNINDTLGHETGDLVLKETAQRLQGILRESDTVARLGGDEFVVLIENIDEPYRGGIIAQKILSAFMPSFLQERKPLSISTSIGIAIYPGDGADAQTLLKNADIAMYRAKEMGRNNYCYFSPEMNQHIAERLALEVALGHALERDQLSLYYQPRIDVATNRIVGMEALLRWWHPTRGLTAPPQFIGVAEETGLIRTIGYWTIRTACTQNKRWQESHGTRLKVSVNLSLRQLTDDTLIDNIESILEETGLDPHYLEFDITESSVMAIPDKALLILDTLQEMGIGVAIDDFGTGNSSLTHLKQFPIQTVKIDRSFVQGIPGNRSDLAITKAIISLAHSLECSVVAEGTETQQQFEFLRENACDSVQGNYFSAPMSAEVFGDLLKSSMTLH